MATDGVFVPEGGVYEVVLSLEKLARHAGVEIKKGEPVREIWDSKVVTAERKYAVDAVVSDIDAARLEGLLDEVLPPGAGSPDACLPRSAPAAGGRSAR